MLPGDLMKTIREELTTGDPKTRKLLIDLLRQAIREELTSGDPKTRKLLTELLSSTFSNVNLPYILQRVQRYGYVSTNSTTPVEVAKFSPTWPHVGKIKRVIVGGSNLPYLRIRAGIDWFTPTYNDWKLPSSVIELPFEKELHGQSFWVSAFTTNATQAVEAWALIDADYIMYYFRRPEIFRELHTTIKPFSRDSSQWDMIPAGGYKDYNIFIPSPEDYIDGELKELWIVWTVGFPTAPSRSNDVNLYVNGALKDTERTAYDAYENDYLTVTSDFALGANNTIRIENKADQSLALKALYVHFVYVSNSKPAGNTSPFGDYGLWRYYYVESPTFTLGPLQSWTFMQRMHTADIRLVFNMLEVTPKATSTSATRSFRAFTNGYLIIQNPLPWDNIGTCRFNTQPHIFGAGKLTGEGEVILSFINDNPDQSVDMVIKSRVLARP